MADRVDKHKTTIYLREGDAAFLRENFPEAGASLVIRKLVSKVVDQMRKGEMPEFSGEIEL